ncbi:hypothetical protein J2D73_10790 [Acetobacter sacchari]|uniref:Uncharacterized protein n=1 Tax=Acetobacter sacchari TaxID=2661687 RepID=A0ABS3LWK4_9PROT|nr:hypothetical protein [Acetobacter sacchari]MBO1360273.1 hypothetical protein [Acetobacter sacchari]
MFRQYYTSPFQGGDNPLRVGTIAAGTIFHIHHCRKSTRPWILEAFLNGEYTAARRNPRTGHWENVFISGRSDLAVLRSLTNGLRRTLTVNHLQHMVEEGAAPEARYPTLPDVTRFYRRNRSILAEATNVARAA